MEEPATKQLRVNSGIIWKTLKNAVNGISVQELCKQLALSFEDVVLAISWLARDLHIGLSDNDGRLVITSGNCP